MAAARDVGDAMRLAQSRMTSPVQGVVFLVLMIATVAATVAIGNAKPPRPEVAAIVFVSGLVVSWFISSAIKVANQWDRGVVLRLGQFRGIRGPGVFFIVPVLDRVRMIDTRILTHHIREQEVITRDNVPVTIDSVLFYRVISPEDAVIKIQDYAFGVAQTCTKRTARRGRRHDFG